MAKRKVKCLYCGEVFDPDSEEYVKPRSNRYAHKACFLLQEEKKTKEEKDKEELENYIKQLFGLNNLSPRIRTQIKRYHDQGFTDDGILKALQYFFEVRGNSIDKANNGIGIVEYVYRESLRYWKDLREVQDKNIETKIDLPVIEIHVEPPQRNPIRQFRKLFTFLDEEDDT